MTKEQEEAIELAENFTKMDFSNPMGWTGYYDTELKELSQAIETALNMLKEKDAEIEEYKRMIAAGIINVAKDELVQEKNKEIEKKDRQIDLMAEIFYKKFKAELLLEYGFENEEQLKQYFKELAERKSK